MLHGLFKKPIYFPKVGLAIQLNEVNSLVTNFEHYRVLLVLCFFGSYSQVRIRFIYPRHPRALLIAQLKCEPPNKNQFSEQVLYKFSPKPSHCLVIKQLACKVTGDFVLLTSDCLS